MDDYHQVINTSETGFQKSREKHAFINRTLKTYSTKKSLLLIIIILCILTVIVIGTVAYFFSETTSNNVKQQNSLWYQKEIIYEINVPTFRDSNEDGFGDLQGIIEKLDYLEKNNIQSILLQSSIFNISDELVELSDRQYGKIQRSNLLALDPHIGDEEDFDDLMETLRNKSMHLILDLPISSSGDHRDLSWYGTHPSSLVSIENPCLRNKNDLGCRYYKIYKRLPLDFSNENVIDQSESRLRYWLEKKNIDGVRVDLPLVFDRLSNTYSICLDTIDRWKLLVKEMTETTKPKLLLFDIPSPLWSIINDLSLNDQIQYSTSVSQFIAKQTVANFWQIGLDREYSRLGLLDEISRRIVFTIGMLSGGTPIVLYGDELGIKQKYETWMSWTADPPYGGFSSCSSGKCHDILSWYETDFLQTNVQNEEGDNESLLIFFRRLSQLRKHQSFQNDVRRKGLQSMLDITWFIREAPGHRGFLIVIHSNRFKQEPIPISFQNLTNHQGPKEICYEYQWPKRDELQVNTDELIIYPGSINIFSWPAQNL